MRTLGVIRSSIAHVNVGVPVLSIQNGVIRIKLREMIEVYEQRTGQRLTYGQLAERTGLASETIQALAVRPTYNTRLSTVAKLCHALRCSPTELLELREAGDAD